MTNDNIEQHPVNRVCRDVSAAFTRALKRVQHKIERQQQELSEARDHATYTRHGEMLLASMALLKRGLTTAELINPYTATPESIRLNPKLDGAENADLYFRKARKCRRGLEQIEKQLAASTAEQLRLQTALGKIEKLRDTLQGDSPQLDECLEQLNSIAETISSSHPRTSVATPSPTPKSAEKSLPAYRRYSIDGFEILVGKNDAQNDELTVHTARPWDIWLHVAHHAGSHVVLRREKSATWPPDHVTNAAAILAAWFSKARHSRSVEVHLCEKRYVQKRRQSSVGEVWLQQYRTLRANPMSPQEICKTLGLKGADPHEREE